MPIKIIDQLIPGGGEMGELIRKKDWSKTSLGVPESWPQSLITYLGIILNSGFPMFLFWGPDLICFYNDAYRPSLGNNGKHPNILGERAEDYWQEIWHIIKPLIDQVLTTGQPSWAEDQLIPIFRNSTIEDVYWTFSYSAVFDENYKAAGVFVTCYETTEKVKAFKNLEQREKQLAFTIDAAELGTWDLDPKTNRFIANDRLKKWFGLEPQKEIELSRALERIVEEDRRRVVEAIEKALDPASGGNYEVEYAIINPEDNKKRFVVAKGKLLYDDKGEAYRFSGTLEDITREKNDKARLEEMKDRFETMANNIPNLSWIANSDGWIFWYNQRWYEYTGTTPKEMEGWGWKSVHDPNLLPEVLDKWQHSIISGQAFEMVFPLKGADNIFRPFLTRIVPIKNQQGEIIRWIGTNTDITKQKEAEKMKENFLSMASHELKTPLTTIKAYAEVMQTLLENGDKQLLNMSTTIVKQTGKLSQIITDLLEVHKLQNDKIEIKKEVFSLNELLMELTVDMTQIINSHTIETKLDRNIQINADRNKLIQVLINLINNAVKYSPSADKVIISSKIEDDFVCISVQDFGIGIAPENQKNLFQQFYRVSGDNEKIFPGMGIGLYISEEIIKTQGGNILVESKPGTGSTFTIQLPK